MAEACNIGCDKLYSWTNKKWIPTGEKQAVLFISTELTRAEIQTCQLAHISGIEEDRLIDWVTLTDEEKTIINESKVVMRESLVYGEHMPDFTISSITSA